MSDDLTYEDLLRRDDQPPGSTWGLFDDPHRGMASLAGPNEVLRGIASVRHGRTFSLDYALDHFVPPLASQRTPLRHQITSTHRDQRDDYIDGFWLQATSQIDGLRHRRHHRYGFYNGFPDEDIIPESDTLGIVHWAHRPIVGRAVLIDLEGYREAEGYPIDHWNAEAIDVAELDRALARQDVMLEAGDCVLIHTGWSEWCTRQISLEERAEITAAKRFTGLANTKETIAWFWDHRVALAGSDTMALEVLPPLASSTYGGSTDRGLIHQDLIALLGLPIGELWNLEELARDSRESGQWDALLMVKPLPLRGGCGSPSNALAIR